MSDTKVDVLIGDYLLRLRTELRFAPLAAREEYLNEITLHIADGRADLDPTDIDGLRRFLERVGDPSELATEFYDSEREAREFARVPMTSGQRLKRLLIPASAILAVGLLIGGIVRVEHYQPLTNGGLTTLPLLGSGGQAVRPLPVSPSVANFSVPVYAMPKGTTTVQIPVLVQNIGSIAIRITAVQSPVDGWPAFGPARIRYGYASGWGGTHRLRPFTLPGHALREIVISIPMHCSASAQTVEFERVAVSTRFFGVSHTVWVNVEPFVIEFAKAC
jgi:hypothetical protein